MNFRNELESLPFPGSLVLLGKAGAYTFQVLPTLGQAPGPPIHHKLTHLNIIPQGRCHFHHLPTNNRLGRKDLLGANTTYYENL
jgi:hypothetical protein